MKLLLDTHIRIWALNQPEQFSAKVRRALQRPGNELYLSPVSIWEARHLAARANSASATVQALGAAGAREGTGMGGSVYVSRGFGGCEDRIASAGPGDVFLAATAITMGLTLVTGDEQLIEYPALSVLANE